MAKLRTQYTIDVNGVPRRLFDIVQNNTGTLTVSIRGAKVIRDDPGSDEWSDLIKSQSFSVHPTLTDPTGNQLHFTGRVDGRDDIPNHHFTRAIKQTNRFAPLFARRYCTLVDERFEPATNSRPISLGSLDEDGFSVLAAVLVSRRDREFDSDLLRDDQKPPLNIDQRVFGEFRLTVLWTFMSAPADPTGTNVIVETARPETLKNSFDIRDNERKMDGYGEQEAVRWFIGACLDMRDDLLTRALAQMPQARRDFFAKFTRFFKEGRPDTEEFQKCLAEGDKFLRLHGPF